MINKYYGAVGFGETMELYSGVWEDVITERKYYGEVIKNIHRWETSQSINDNINISNQISLLADPYAYSHLSTIKYVEFAGAKWKVTNIDIQSPRLILTIGGVYDGPAPTITD